MKSPISIFTVHGQSMVPTLKPGQKLISLNWGYRVDKGDLVAIDNEGRLMVKRVERMEKDQIFVVGDNKKMSTDSRKFGWVDREKVIGKIILVV